MDWKQLNQHVSSSVTSKPTKVSLRMSQKRKMMTMNPASKVNVSLDHRSFNQSPQVDLSFNTGSVKLRRGGDDTNFNSTGK